MIALIHLNTSNNENSLPIKEASLIYRELMCAWDNLDKCVCVCMFVSVRVIFARFP